MIKETHLLVKSFGFGVYQASMVPPMNNDLSILEEKIKNSGLLNVQKIITVDPNKAYFLLGQGQEPSKYELEFFNEAKAELMKLSEDHSELLQRLKMFDS
jgi:hypothetical protein